MMRLKIAALLLSAMAMPALAAPPAGFEKEVETLRQKIGAPGVAIAIVENGKTNKPKIINISVFNT